MAVWSIIKKGELQRALRMDAEYYQPQYLFLDKEFSSKKLKLAEIRDVSIFVKKGIFDISPNKYIDQGVPLIRVQNIRSGFLNYNNMVFISDNDHLKYKNTELSEGDLVLSKVGTIGEVAIISEKDRKCNFSQNAIGVKINKKRIKSEYLLLYFLSSLGQLQLLRSQMFQVQSKLELEDIRDLKVVLLDNLKQEELRKIVVEVVDLRESSEKIYSQAEQILLEEIGLKNIDLKDDLFYTTTLKEVKDNNRMDAEYYLPKYEKLMEHIFSFNYNLLGKLAKFKKGVEPGSDKYFKTGKPFLRVSNLSKFEITNNNQKYLENNLYMQLKKSYEPKKGEILLSKDATPGVAYVLKESIECIISSGILRLEVAASIKIEYLALVINSQVGQMQMKRDSGGSIINHWKIDQIKNLEIPLLTNDTQKKIEILCCESFLKRKQAKQLLEQAKHKVEEMIEKEAGVK